MQKLKSIIKQAISRDLLQIYSKCDPTAEDYSIVVHSYQLLSQEKKKQFSQSLHRKLRRDYENMETLNLLLLCDFLSATNPELLNEFPENMLRNYEAKSKIKPQTKQEKLKLAQSCFILFYVQYLKQKIWGQKFNENLNINNVHEGVVYCQAATQALKLVIRHDFIADYVLSHSPYKNQVKIAIQNMLRRSSEDLSILIRFVDKWNHIIVEESNYSLMVNDIYEQLIFISKNISKLEYLNNKIKVGIKFPRYEINKKLNMSIQKSMLGKQVQKRQFLSQKRLRTEGDTNEDQPEITQSQICVKFKL